MAKKPVEASPKEKLQLLSKSNWSYLDISKYFGFGINKAIKIKKDVQASGGGCRYEQSLVLTDKVLEHQGTSLEVEVERLRTIVGEDDGKISASA